MAGWLVIVRPGLNYTYECVYKLYMYCTYMPENTLIWKIWLKNGPPWGAIRKTISLLVKLGINLGKDNHMRGGGIETQQGTEKIKSKVILILS